MNIVLAEALRHYPSVFFDELFIDGVAALAYVCRATRESVANIPDEAFVRRWIPVADVKTRAEAIELAVAVRCMTLEFYSPSVGVTQIFRYVPLIQRALATQWPRREYVRVGVDIHHSVSDRPDLVEQTVMQHDNFKITLNNSDIDVEILNRCVFQFHWTRLNFDALIQTHRHLRAGQIERARISMAWSSDLSIRCGGDGVLENSLLPSSSSSS
jgi:hypothetical protein